MLQVAVLNANYMAARLQDHYKVLFKGAHGKKGRGEREEGRRERGRKGGGREGEGMGSELKELGGGVVSVEGSGVDKG